MTHKLSAEFYADKAKRELNETESRKEQSLKKFYEWIDKHPFISNVYADDLILLSYLRANKYNLNRTFESFEYVISKYIVHEFESPLDKPLELLENGYIKIFKKRDENGCRNVLFDFGKLDPKKFSFGDMRYLGSIACFTILREAETQISGINVYVDMSHFTMEHLTIFLSNKATDCIHDHKVLPCRVKKIIFIGLSTFTENFVEFCKKFISEKLKQRILLAKNCNLVGEIEDMTSKFDQTRKCYELFIQAKVGSEAFKKYPKYETVDSFRQLEID